jgi:hypothetical protein
MPIIRSLCLAAVLSAALVSHAAALSYEDIAGRWCGVGVNYRFERTSLTVTFHDATPTRHFKVTKYEYLPHIIILNWVNGKGENVQTHFSEFAADGRSMAQVKNESGPRRPFSRCK